MASAWSAGAAVWGVPVSDRVVSPVIRRAHRKGQVGTAHPVALEIPT